MAADTAGYVVRLRQKAGGRQVLVAVRVVLVSGKDVLDCAHCVAKPQEETIHPIC